METEPQTNVIENAETTTSDAKLTIGSGSPTRNFKLSRQCHKHWTAQHTDRVLKIEYNAAQYAKNIPKIEIGKLDGNPLRFCKVMKPFQLNVANSLIQNSQRLLYLLQYYCGNGKKAENVVCVYPEFMFIRML